MSKRLMPTYLVNFLKEIYDGTIPSNFGKRMVSRQFIARVKELYETLGGDNPSDYSRRMVNEYLIKFFNEIEIVEYTDDDVLMTKTIPSDLVYPACRIDAIGGMSYVVDGVIQDSPVTAVKSYGANLFDIHTDDTYSYQYESWNPQPVKGNDTNTYVENDTINCNSRVGTISYLGFKVNFNKTGTYIVSFDKNNTNRSCFSVLNKTDMAVVLCREAITTSGKITVTFTIDDLSKEYYLGFTNYSNSSILSNIMLNYGSTALPYTPYKGLIDTYTVPSAITSLEGYGQGDPDNPTVYNLVDFVAGKYYEKGYINNGTWVSKVAEISITEQAPLLECVGSGSIVFENTYNQDMPNEVTTWIKES